MFRENYSTIGGKVSILTAVLAVAILLVGVLGELPHGRIAKASTATTSVTVLNTPPIWDTNVYAQETIASATASPSLPTNSGNLVNWYASATDSSLDNYYLLICNNFASPTPNVSAAPTCGAGNAGHLIAVSAATPSGVAATAATTTFNGDVTEIFYYYSYICDGNTSGASCNSFAFSPSSNPIPTVATTSPNLSPFIVNHTPTFTGFVNTSPINPGGSSFWVATATDQDNYGGRATDTVKLFVCKATDFTGTACGPAGTWATSSFVTNSATASITISTPYPKGQFGAYGYILDAHGSSSATGVLQGSNSPFIVNNVAPSITAASVSIFSSTGTIPLILTNLATQTQNFSVQYTVTDQNSCMTASSTSEITGSIINVYRSSVGSTSCKTSANYNANRCYPGVLPTSVWNYNCTPGACAGTSSATQVWTCTFPLWYIADATDVGSQFTADNWLATASSSDSSFASSTLVESQTGTELIQFLGYDLSTTTIAYGGLQPGNSANLTSSTSVGLLAQGNVGLDETLYGDDMCPTYPICFGNATNTIFVANQKYASATMTYAAATSTLNASTSPALFALHVPKTIATSTPNSLNTYWGILVPGTITLSGSYIGRNTIIGATSPSSSW